jgi:hypothetical protein
MKTTMCRWTVLAAAVLVPSAAWGQEGAGAKEGAPAVKEGEGAEYKPPSTPRDPASGARTLPSREALSFQLIGAGDVVFESDLDDSPGSLSTIRAGGGLEVGVPVGERARLTTLFFGEQSWYDFSDATGLVPGTDDPLDEAYRLVLRPLLSWQVSQDWGVFCGGSLNWGAENGADLSDALTVGGIAGARYRFSDSFSLSFGLGVASQLEDSTEFFPLIGVDWQIDEQTRLSSTGDEGVGLRLTHAVSEHWSVLVQGSYESREFRLADDNALSEGAMRDRRVPVAAGVSYSPSQSVTLQLLGGVVAWQELRFDDSGGNEVSEVNADPAPFVRLILRVYF